MFLPVVVTLEMVPCGGREEGLQFAADTTTVIVEERESCHDYGERVGVVHHDCGGERGREGVAMKREIRP